MTTPRLSALMLLLVAAPPLALAQGSSEPAEQPSSPGHRLGLRLGGGLGPIAGIGVELELGKGPVALALDLGTSGGIGLLIGGRRGGPYVHLFGVAVVGNFAAAISAGGNLGWDFRLGALSVRPSAGLLKVLAASNSSEGKLMPSFMLAAGWANDPPASLDEGWPAFITRIGVGVGYGRGLHLLMRLRGGEALDWETWAGVRFQRPEGPQLVLGLAGTGYLSLGSPRHRLFAQLGAQVPIPIDEGSAPARYVPIALVVVGYSVQAGPVDLRAGPELVGETVVGGALRVVLAGMLTVELRRGDGE